MLSAIRYLLSGTWIVRYLILLIFLLMDNNRHMKIMFWNVRGINSQEKWDAIRDKISESACHIICLQESKREVFDSFYIKRFCPRNIDNFAYSPSIGASGGLLTAWNSSMFDGSVVHVNSYDIMSVTFMAPQVPLRNRVSLLGS